MGWSARKGGASGDITGGNCKGVKDRGEEEPVQKVKTGRKPPKRTKEHVRLSNKNVPEKLVRSVEGLPDFNCRAVSKEKLNLSTIRPNFLLALLPTFSRPAELNKKEGMRKLSYTHRTIFFRL